MKRIRKRLTYANVMSSVAVFLVVGGATALAASHLGKKSVGAPQLKSNAVTTAKIKKNAVTTKKIAKGAVDSSKVKDDSLTGSDINESTLGTVPSAASADNLVGLARFNFKLPFGGSRTFLTAGPFSLTAVCLQNANTFNEPPIEHQDIARVLISTNTNGVVFDALNAKRGEKAGGTEEEGFLETTTPEKERVFYEEQVPTGEAIYQAQPDETSDGAAYSPNGVAFSVDPDGFAIGINVFGPGCFFNGSAVVENQS